MYYFYLIIKNMSLVYSKDIKVSEEHLDQNNHVNNVQYVHWVEEIAAEHWDSVKHICKYSDDYWVMYDHHIQYKKQLFLNDIVTIKTYPLPPDGVKQPRKVEFYCNGKLMVDSRTLWILFEKETNRMRRLESDWLDQFSEEE